MLFFLFLNTHHLAQKNANADPLGAHFRKKTRNSRSGVLAKLIKTLYLRKNTGLHCFSIPQVPMRFLLVSTAVLVAGCSDYNFNSQCTSRAPAFDIEEVSALEDAWGSEWWTADAVVVDSITPENPEASWRVVSVDVLVMVPKSHMYGSSPWPSEFEGAPLTVEVYDTATLTDTSAQMWSLTQNLNTADLEWSPHTFPEMTSKLETEYLMAWWNFNIAGETSDAPMTADQFAVGLRWPEMGVPEVGYSNFDRPCDANWTINVDGPNKWQHNSATNNDDTCSWPMFRVETEVVWESEVECPN